MDEHPVEAKSVYSRANNHTPNSSEAENPSQHSLTEPGNDISQNPRESRTFGARSDVHQQKNKPKHRQHPRSSTPHIKNKKTNSQQAFSTSCAGTQQNTTNEAMTVTRTRQTRTTDPRFPPSSNWERVIFEQTQVPTPFMAVKMPQFDRVIGESGARMKANWHGAFEARGSPTRSHETALREMERNPLEDAESRAPRAPNFDTGGVERSARKKTNRHQAVESTRSLDESGGSNYAQPSPDAHNAADGKVKSRGSKNRRSKPKQKKIIVSPGETPGSDSRPLIPSYPRVRCDSSSSIASDTSTSSATSFQDYGSSTSCQVYQQGEKQKLKLSRNQNETSQGKQNYNHEGLLQDNNFNPGTHVEPAQLGKTLNPKNTDRVTNITRGGDQPKRVIVFSPPSSSSPTSDTADAKPTKNQRSSRQKSSSTSCISESGDINKEISAGSTAPREKIKACKVEICFSRPTDLNTVQRYLAQDYIMPTTRYNYEIEVAQVNKPGTSRYLAVFPSVNQGKKAVKCLQKYNQGREAESGETKMSVRLLNKEVSTDSAMINSCAKEIREKADGVMADHDKKIKEVEREIGRLPKGKKRKGMSLELFDEVEPKKKALNTKIAELKNQKREFSKFMEDFHEKIQALEETGSELSQKLTQLRTCFGRELRQLETALPIYARKTEIIETVRDSQVCVLLAETGSGKSTQITQYLYEAGFADGGLIVCTQPRKVAATSLANYVSGQMGSPPGQLVSSIVGARGKRSAKTAILYMTDHALLNECLRDPTLSKYSCVIVDEAHERSIFTDLLLGMIKRTLNQRKDLRIVITSATINPGLFMSYFSGCQKLEISGRMFPVEISWKEMSCEEGEYVKEAVSMACEVHRTEGNGDVLVFLTSPAEIQKACDMMSSKVRPAEVDCLPLHGKLRPEDQKKVFQQLVGKRKIIFATNCAETSVTIPGIKFVIDSGMVKEMRYDARRNMNSLEVRPINQSSAEQRKGRAGRTEAGKCFRLYSKEKYQAMDKRSTPEILRIHLGQAILKLMELGIGDPTLFDFVESPPSESLQSACQSLISLGAIQEGCLTELGRKMARLPMEPRLAKLLVEGINEGVGNEALILTSVAAANGSIFFRMGTDEEKKQHDMRKIQFCHPGGDLITLLSVYQDWSALPEKDRSKWCYDNSLNAKAMRMAAETVKELRTILKQEFSIDNLHRSRPSSTQASPALSKHPTSETDDINAKLQKIILTCYALNICMFTGNERAGYKVACLRNCVQLHPSSSLKYLDHSPEFVVYEQLMKTSKDYILSVTPVEREWVEEHVERGLVSNLTSKDLEELESEVLVASSVLCSKEIMQTAVGVGFKGRNLRSELEDKVSQRCSGALTVIEPDCDKGVVKIYIPRQYKEIAVDVVESQLEKERQRHRMQSTEVPVDPNSNDVRVVIGRGWIVQHVLMPKMYRSVVVHEVPDDILLEDVLTWLGDIGEVVQHKSWVNNGKAGVSVLFHDPQQALQAVQLAGIENCGFIVKPDYKTTSTANNSITHSANFTVKVSWPRRKSSGMASIKFHNPEDFSYASGKLVGRSFFIHSSLAVFLFDKHRNERIFVRRLNPNVCETDLKTFVEKELNAAHDPTQIIAGQGIVNDDNDEVDGSDDDEDSRNVDYVSDGAVNDRPVNVLDAVTNKQKIEVEDTLIIREKGYESTDEECKQLKTRLQSEIKRIVPNARFQVKLSRPKKPGIVSWWAFVEFSDPTDGHTVVRELDGKSVNSNSFGARDYQLVYKLTPQLQCRITCLKKTYSAVKETLHGLEKTIADDCRRRCGRVVKSEHNTTRKGDRVQLQLDGECLEHYVYMRSAVGQVLSGDKLDCKVCEGMEVLLTKYGREALQRVEKDTGATILPDWRTCTVSIFGSEELKSKAKIAINDFLRDVLDGSNELWYINLRGQDNPRGLIKAIIKRFGPDLKQLESMEGVVRASLDLRKHVLNIQSTPDGRAAVEAEINVCKATLPPPCQAEPDTPAEECPVCLVEPDDNQYRLVCCGHVYCRDCINGQLQARELPLKCAREGCEEEFVFRDLQQLLKQHEQRSLTSEAVKKYVGGHPDEVRYCTTPNCQMVYRVTEEGQRFACSTCSAEICTACHMEYHGGISCAMYQSEKRDGGEENLKRWMEEDTKNRKHCPKCKAIIEKNGGCNHMTCSQCHEHICWLCLAMCGSADGFYNHQSNCPRR